MKRTLAITIALLASALTAHGSQKAAYTWTALDEGLAYAKVYVNQGTDEAPRMTTVHALRIDPRRLRLDVLTPPKDKPRGDSIENIAKRSGAIVAVNGGFFTPEHKSIGLLVQSGRRINPIHNTSWWSVFGIRNGRASILPPWKAKHVRNYRMAVQAGPRLVVSGRIQRLKDSNPAARTAIGIAKSGHVIIAATEGARLSMRNLAGIMHSSRNQNGLECPDAMALDGGSSTQLYAKAGKLKLSLKGFSSVPNGIGVFRK
jgi:uncharacterized protein YigE (DUF2233 family)